MSGPLRNLVGHVIKPDYGYLERIYPHERALQQKRDAAPELYEALLDIRNRILCPVGPAPSLDEVQEIASAALAKAEAQQ